jgi:hypothetical protein
MGLRNTYRLLYKTAALLTPAIQCQKLLLRLWGLLYLFISGTITLKTIFNYFQHYIFNRYKFINRRFEKPGSVLFQKYRIAPLFLHLKQWQTANEVESLIVVHYAMKPKNPV